MPEGLVLETNKSRPHINIVELVSRIHSLTNEERIRHGAPALSYDNSLAVIAYGHSSDMANRNYFEHVNPEGEDGSMRAERGGYNCTKIMNTTTIENESGTFVITYYQNGIGENLFLNSLFDWEVIKGNETYYHWILGPEIAKTTVTGWMESPAHRANMLETDYTKERIGIIISQDDRIYITQNFC